MCLSFLLQHCCNKVMYFSIHCWFVYALISYILTSSTDNTGGIFKSFCFYRLVINNRIALTTYSTMGLLNIISEMFSLTSNIIYMLYT